MEVHVPDVNPDVPEAPGAVRVEDLVAPDDVVLPAGDADPALSGANDHVVLDGLIVAASVADETGQSQIVKSGFLILSPEGMVELRSQIDQMLGELERRGVLNLRPDKLDG